MINTDICLNHARIGTLSTRETDFPAYAVTHLGFVAEVNGKNMGALLYPIRKGTVELSEFRRLILGDPDVVFPGPVQQGRARDRIELGRTRAIASFGGRVTLLDQCANFDFELTPRRGRETAIEPPCICEILERPDLGAFHLLERLGGRHEGSFESLLSNIRGPTARAAALDLAGRLLASWYGNRSGARCRVSARTPAGLSLQFVDSGGTPFEPGLSFTAEELGSHPFLALFASLWSGENREITQDTFGISVVHVIGDDAQIRMREDEINDPLAKFRVRHRLFRDPAKESEAALDDAGAHQEVAPRRWLSREEVEQPKAEPPIHPETAPMVDEDQIVLSPFKVEAVPPSGSPVASQRFGPKIVAAKKPPQARQLQSQVLDAADKTTAYDHFAPESSYLVRVQIGNPKPKKTKWVSTGEVIDESVLPPSATGHSLDVVFFEPTYGATPLTKKVFLPPTGDSGTCDFPLTLDASGIPVAAKIIVLFQKRILEAGLLCGGVLGDEATRGEIQLVRLVNLHPNFTNLDLEQPFDYSMLVEHDGAGGSQLTGLGGENAVAVKLASLSEFVEKIDAGFRVRNWENKDLSDLAGTASTELFRYLASHGSSLYQALVSDLKGGQCLENAQRIQVVSSVADARLPLEFCYDAAYPSANATMCPNYPQALGSGSCQSCPGKSSALICPLAFWGLGRVVERHRFDREDERLPDSADFLLQLQTNHGQLLDRPGRVLFAASNRVKLVRKDAIEVVAQALTRSFPRMKQLESWAPWAQAIHDLAPDVIMLLPHTELDLTTSDLSLEIGNELIKVGQINRSMVCVPEGRTLPIVFLLGCETGAAAIGFESVAAQFRRAGAAIVVSSIANILGRHASGVAAEFVDELAALKPGTELSFGEIVRDVRRRLLLKGIPVVLAVVAYGDADWRFR